MYVMTGWVSLLAIALLTWQVPGDGTSTQPPRTQPPTTPQPTRPSGKSQWLVEQLDLERYKSNIAKLASFGTRYFSTDGNKKALQWLDDELTSYGYDVVRQPFTAKARRGITGGMTVENLYVTKVGRKHPDRMYIVSAHMDSYNTESADQSFAPGANDDASGSSLVLEAARVFASIDLDVTVRFVWWNAEEIGLIGSKHYVLERHAQQGVEVPPGSGRYPEPKWLGVIQHDMLMFDHGMPRTPRNSDDPPRVSDRQSRRADIDVEYDSRNDFGGAAQSLAMNWLRGNIRYSARYPAEIGSNMAATDSVPFAPHCPSISVRENQRLAEIGRGGDPHWHKNSDVPDTFSDADYRLGFNATQMTVGAVADLVGARPAVADGGPK